MKREYIIPVTEVHKIELENAFCLNASDTVGDDPMYGKDYDDEDGYWE